MTLTLVAVLFSCSNCTERGRGWPCCVPNYLRTFPKIATETSLRVRLLASSSATLLLPFLFLTSLSIVFARLPLQMMPRGSSWKAPMTTSTQITSTWVHSSSAASLFFISQSISVSHTRPGCQLTDFVAGWSFLPTTQNTRGNVTAVAVAA